MLLPFQSVMRNIRVMYPGCRFALPWAMCLSGFQPEYPIASERVSPPFTFLYQGYVYQRVELEWHYLTGQQ